MHLEHNFVLRQRPRFIRTENIYGAEILNGIQIFDDDLFPRHRNASLGKASSHDHRKHFRRESHGNADGKKHGVQPVVFGKAVDQQDDGDHDQHKADEYARNRIDPLVKSGLAPSRRRESSRRLPEHGICSRRKDDPLPAAAHNVGPHKGKAGARCGRFSVRKRIFFDGGALPRQCGLRHKQIARG